VIDGSGVLHDPIGIDRTELIRLAKERKMISHFDVSKLSKDGYRILCEDLDVTLPSGELVPDGQQFRNVAHLRYKADILVPCGGRPEAINSSNVAQLWDSEGKTNFKYIVEGANLFITQQARLALEKRGVILFKDASANKVCCHQNQLYMEANGLNRAVSLLLLWKSWLALVSMITVSST